MSTLPVLAPRMPGTIRPDVEAPCSREHTEAEWEAKKEIINQLYIRDNRKLSETMAILEAKYAFPATEQMYKKRLKKWHIRKRAYRKGEISTAVSSPASNLASMDQRSPDVEEVLRSDTPQQAVVPFAQPSSLEPYAGLEVILGSVFSWSQSKLETQIITSDPMSRYLANPELPPIQDSRTMYRTFELVFDLWSRGKGNLAGMAARKGFYVLEYVLTEDHPDLVWHVLDTIYDMVDSRHIQLLGMFLGHATILARQKLPPQHPLLRILQQLGKCDYQTDPGRASICHLLRQAWLRNVDVLGRQIGSLSPHHLWLYEQLIWDGRTRLRKNSDLKKKKEVMTAALQQLMTCQDAYTADADSERLRKEALMLEFTQMDVGDKVKAEELARKLLEHTQDPGAGSRADARFHAYARKMLARILEEQGDFTAAEENLRWAINKREAAHGANTNLRVVRDMWVLAAYFQRTGRQVEAEQVAQDAINRATRYLDDVPG